MDIKTDGKPEQRRQIEFLITRTSGMERALFSSRRRLGTLLSEYLDDGGSLNEFDIDSTTLDLLIATSKVKRSQ